MSQSRRAVDSLLESSVSNLECEPGDLVTSQTSGLNNKIQPWFSGRSPRDNDSPRKAKEYKKILRGPITILEKKKKPRTISNAISTASGSKIRLQASRFSNRELERNKRTKKVTLAQQVQEWALRGKKKLSLMTTSQRNVSCARLKTQLREKQKTANISTNRENRIYPAIKVLAQTPLLKLRPSSLVKCKSNETTALVGRVGGNRKGGTKKRTSSVSLHRPVFRPRFMHRPEENPKMIAKSEVNKMEIVKKERFPEFHVKKVPASFLIEHKNSRYLQYQAGLTAYHRQSSEEGRNLKARVIMDQLEFIPLRNSERNNFAN